jgi:hypothetical protein
MHMAQSLPRCYTRAGAVSSDVSGASRAYGVFGVGARPDSLNDPAEKQLPKPRNSEGGRVVRGRGEAGRVGRLAFALLVAAAFFTAGRVESQNLAQNAEFDTDIPPWTSSLGDASVVWTGLDHDGCDAAISGAALVTNSAANTTQGRGISVCITDFVSDQVYTFGADLRLPPGQARTGSAIMKLVFLASTDCTGFSRTTVDSAPLDTSNLGNWVRLQQTGLPTEDDGSVALVARLVKNEAGGSLQVDVDGAFLVPGEDFLFADGFERPSTCHWSTTSF